MGNRMRPETKRWCSRLTVPKQKTEAGDTSLPEPSRRVGSSGAASGAVQGPLASAEIFAASPSLFMLMASLDSLSECEHTQASRAPGSVFTFGGVSGRC